MILRQNLRLCQKIPWPWNFSLLSFPSRWLDKYWCFQLSGQLLGLLYFSCFQGESTNSQIYPPPITVVNVLPAHQDTDWQRLCHLNEQLSGKSLEGVGSLFYFPTFLLLDTKRNLIYFLRYGTKTFCLNWLFALPMDIEGPLVKKSMTLAFEFI